MLPEVIDKDALEFPKAAPVVEGDGRLIFSRADAACLYCAAAWGISEAAADIIRIRAVAEVPDVLVRCPSCWRQHVLRPEGGQNVRREGSSLVISAPKKGFFLYKGAL